MRRVLIVFLSLMIFATPALAQDANSSLLENTPIGSGGIEIFPEPDRESERLFAVMGDFAPHIAGNYTDTDGRAWVYFYYIEAGQWVGAWALASQFELEDSALEDLPQLDPNDLPQAPDMPFNRLAVRPSGVTSTNTQSDDASSGAVIFDVYDCLFVSGTEFTWNVVEVTYEDGVAVSADVLEEGLSGEWRPGCPGLPQQQLPSGDGGIVSSGDGSVAASSSGGLPYSQTFTALSCSSTPCTISGDISAGDEDWP
jgi:hypothetical protein